MNQTKKQLSSKTLLTGFQPFQNESVNPSKMIVEALQRQQIENLSTLVLPVSYHQAVEILCCELQKTSYDQVILLGQAGGRSQISLERIAVNWVESSVADEAGFKCSPASLSDTLNLDLSKFEIQPAIFSNYRLLDSKIEELKSKEIAAASSLSAGAFVCNAVYFAALSLLMKSKANTEVLFVHTPYLPEQCDGKIPTPASMEFKKQLQAVEIILGLS